MTRYLSSALGAAQPLFGQSIMELERASGRPSADIRLSSEMMQQARLKITELGLDPNDTTGPELYGALQQRLSIDEANTRRALSLSEDAPTADILGRIEKFLSNHETTGNCFALKATVARKLFKKKAPKNTMKLLGYRSLDSMLKHEAVASIYAASIIAESASWQRSFHGQYTNLQPSDFEQRKMAIVYPKAKRWTAISDQFVQAAKHNIMCFKELGAVVILPFNGQVEGITLTSLLLSLHYLNDIRTYSSFAKLQQVKPSFGKIIQDTAAAEPMTTATLAGQPVPWKVIQRYYGRMAQESQPEVFEPHVQAE